MRKTKTLLFAAIFAVVGTSMLSSCASLTGSLYGGLYTKVMQPGVLLDNVDAGSKVGTSDAMNILGIIGMGDYGYNEAIQNGNIKRVSHVDFEVFGVLGLFTKITTYVYGN